MAAARKGQASLGTFGYRLRSVLSQSEKVSRRRQPDPPGNLAQYDIQIKDDHKLRHIAFTYCKSMHQIQFYISISVNTPSPLLAGCIHANWVPTSQLEG